MLFVEHVTKKYGKLTASDDITFRVENGQIAVSVSYTHLDVYKRQGL